MQTNTFSFPKNVPLLQEEVAGCLFSSSQTRYRRSMARKTGMWILKALFECVMNFLSTCMARRVVGNKIIDQLHTMKTEMYTTGVVARSRKRNENHNDRCRGKNQGKPTELNATERYEGTYLFQQLAGTVAAHKEI